MHALKTISKEEIERRLFFDNPWWKNNGRVDKHYQDLPKRSYFPSFYKLVQQDINRAIVLMGPRRVGKTVMALQAIDALLTEGISPYNILYISLETPLYTGMALEEMVNMFQDIHQHSRKETLFIVFDEIQYLPKWEIHLKSLVDSYPAYQFIATGSAAAALKLKSKESGAGRFTDFLLPPLTFSEYLAFIEKEDTLIATDGERFSAVDIEALNTEFVNYLNYGGYPEAVLSITAQEDSARCIKSDIIDKVLLRDLPSVYGIADVQELNALFATIAYNTSNEISLESLSQSSGVSKSTIKKYLTYLEAAFLIKIIHRVDIHAKKFKRATRFKVYLTNPSMRAALFGTIKDDDEAMGSLVETAIFSQWLHIDGGLHYARWNNGEVDIVNTLNNWCVEIKWSDLVVKDARKLKGFIGYIKQNKISNNTVTTKTISQERIIDDTLIEFLPSALYAYTLGKNILKHL
ncbi:similar to ATPase (AAA+ superfamily) [Bathymodiolus thermophilus thioautotrophic gill symbiont]|nr:ATP-binding protein [Bathymodiolus thermophilus thioautotrophic gill symbiont]SHA07140.1 similar to ATPase (AAA+ superfamily) [Bathymodiolus thermophilus thioautotrophic gill symbiont]